MTKEQKLKMMGGIMAPAQEELPEETLDEAIMAEELCIRLHGVNRTTLANQVAMLEKAQQGIIRVVLNSTKKRTSELTDRVIKA